MESFSRVASALFISAAVVVAAAVGAQAYTSVKAAENVISITGSAQKIITSDRARWTISLERTTADLNTLKEGNQLIGSDLKALLGFLEKGGIAGSGVTVQPLRVDTLVNYNAGGTPTAYHLAQTVTVESDDVQKVTALAKKSNELLAQGALISSTNLEYFYSKLPELRIAMLAEATSDAQARAKKIAESAGSVLGGLKSAAQGVFQLTAVNSTDVSDYGMYDTSSIEKQITAVVRASFGVR